MNTLFNDNDKAQIGRLVIEKRERSGFTSDTRFARSIGFGSADMSNLRGEKWRQNQALIGPDKWVRLARTVGFQKNDRMKWYPAETEVKKFVDKQLHTCKEYSFTGILVDDAGIGKSYACKRFAENNPNVYYIDCSQVRTRNRFIRAIAREVGVDASLCYDDMLEDAIYVLQQTHKPLIIIDEAGELEDRALAEIKRMYNALENICGFYLVGADGLKKYISGGIRSKKRGFIELFSRFGRKFSTKMPLQIEDKVAMLEGIAKTILAANGVTDESDVKRITNTLFEKGLSDMRAVQREVIKLRIKQNA